MVGSPGAPASGGTTAPFIEVRGLHHSYGRGDSGLSVLRGLDMAAAAGEHISLMGPSGSGKTTLLSVLGGLDAPQKGTVTVAGRNLARMSRPELAAYRRATVGFVFQHGGLLESLTAQENVEVALAIGGSDRGRQRTATAAGLLDSLGLSARADHRPSQLSGGERQRVAITRALANRPALLLADEPTGNLDTETSAAVVSVLESLPRLYGCTLMIVTHDAALAARAGRRLRLEHGRLVETPGPIPLGSIS